MNKKEDLRVRKTKKSLYEALLTIMKEKSFEEIKVSDICNMAMTNRSTFYDHFTDKYELFDSLIKDLEIELITKLEKNISYNNSKEYYMNMIKLLFDHISENMDVYSSIINKNRNSIIMDMVYNTLVRDVKEHLIRTDIDAIIPVEIVSSFYVSGVINVCMDYFRNDSKYNKNDILKYLNLLIPNNIYVN